MAKYHTTLALALLLCHAATAFVPYQGRAYVSPTAFKPALFMSSSENEQQRKQRRRRRRKDPVVMTPPPPPDEAPKVVEPPKMDLKPRKDGPVEMEIKDVRRVVSGDRDVVETPNEPTKAVQEEDDEEEDEDDDDDEEDEYEYYYIDDEGNEVAVAEDSLNSLDQLLVDARQMEKEEERQRALKADEKEESSIQSTISKVLSTIVTVDFFVVCALLLWFLAGIFCSYILKNDAVQIAFNGIFEPVVQPALGVLMIGSAAGALFNKEEEEY